MKKLIVHVGYSKCGSTTIQDTLTANYYRLQENKVLFPKILSESPSWLRFFWEKNLPALYHEEWVASTFRKFSKALRGELESSDCETVILSDEGLISVSEETILDFKLYLEQEFPAFEIHIVIIVREPISFFTSRAQQFISDRFFDLKAIHEFLNGEDVTNGWSRADNLAMNPNSFYSKQIGLYDKYFSNIHILEFENMITGDGGLTHAFLESFGLDIQLEDIRRNESRSARSIELIAFINNRFPFASNNQLHTGVKRQYRDLHALHSISGEKYELPLSIRRDLLIKTSSEVDWLRIRSGINYCDFPFRAAGKTVVWDEYFFVEIVKIFPEQKLFVQFAILLFVRENITCVDPDSAVVFEKIQEWIESRYPWRSKISRSSVKYVLRLEKFLRKLLGKKG
jgi:hypothetical protein